MWQLNCLLLYRDYKDFKKHLLTKVSIKKNFSEYISRQLKEHQHKIRSKTGILLEITVFKWLIVSLTPRKFLLWQQYQFYLFQLASCLSVNLLWCQECTFYCALRKRCTVFSEGTDVHIQQYIHHIDLNLCQSLYYYGKVNVELEKNTTNLTVFMVLVI